MALLGKPAAVGWTDVFRHMPCRLNAARSAKRGMSTCADLVMSALYPAPPSATCSSSWTRLVNATGLSIRCSQCMPVVMSSGLAAINALTQTVHTHSQLACLPAPGPSPPSNSICACLDHDPFSPRRRHRHADGPVPLRQLRRWVGIAPQAANIHAGAGSCARAACN